MAGNANYSTDNSFTSFSLEVSMQVSADNDNYTAPPQYGAVPGVDECTATKNNSQPAAGCIKTTAFRHLITFTGLALATYLGVSVRLGLTEFSQWDGITHFPSFWAQVVGTLIIGVSAAQKEGIQATGTFSFVYTLITTGLCGSMTTFSSWNVEAGKVLLQLNDTTLQHLHRSLNGERVVGFVTVLLLGVGMPLSVFYLGKHTSSLLIHIGDSDGLMEKMVAAFQKKRPWFFPIVNLCLFVSITSTIIAVCLHMEQYTFLFSLLFGSPGTYMRWCLSSLDKTNFKYTGSFPIGTFLTNVIGSFILAVILVIISYNTTDTKDIQYALLNGIAIGFCGSLTTVSTFVSQISSLSFRMSVCYVLVSIAVSQLIINAIFLLYQVVL